MAEAERKVTFEEFADNLGEFFDRVARENETIIVEKSPEEAIVLKPARPKRRRKRTRTEADYEAFLSSAGGWKDLVDTEKLVEDIYLSRSMPPRPPVRF